MATSGLVENSSNAIYKVYAGRETGFNLGAWSCVQVVGLQLGPKPRMGTGAKHKLSFFLLSTFQYLQICNSFPPCSGSECLNGSLLL